MVGGGPFQLRAGEWTDDTAMALALADSLLFSGALDERDLMGRFINWYRNGAYSCTGRCFDIGVTTARALRKFELSNDPVAGSTDPDSAGNGSLMRLAPVAIRYWRDHKRIEDAAARQSITTHGAPEAVSACVSYAKLISDAIAGKPLSELLAPREEGFGKIRTIMSGSWRGKKRDAIRSSGYVAHSLEAALWSIGRTSDFQSALLMAVNLGEDADTTGAITGQLAGAIYGLNGIPNHWLSRLADRRKIEEAAQHLLALAE
jgi:ADP-ribosyl-[dinitrogen reductase] hydrolase